MNQQKYVLPQVFPQTQPGQVHQQGYPQVIQTQPMVAQQQQPLMVQPQMMQPQGQGAVQHQSTMVMQQTQRYRIAREWSTGLMDCCSDLGSCCGVCFCPVCYTMLLSTEMEENCCVPLCVPCPHLALRIKVRSMEKIRGSILSDCCVACCCGPCAICQIKREWQNIQKVKSGVNLGGAF